MANKSSKTQTFSFTVDLKMIIYALIALNVLTIFLWRPWQDATVGERTITINGEAVLEAEPDRYLFNPSYELTADTQDKVLDEATKKANTVIDGLKKIGVDEADIKLDANSYGYWWYDDNDDKHHTYVYISIDVSDKDLAQTIQDFLLDTDPQGQITPSVVFSETKQKELETEARKLAIADARQKAEQSADELGARIGKVVTVNEGYGFGDYPIAYDEVRTLEASDASRSLPIQPGENEYSFSLTVVFELK